MYEEFVAERGEVEDGPGLWEPSGTSGVLVSCPSCGRPVLIDGNINSDGEIASPVECPFYGCSFHGRIILDGFASRSQAK